MSRESLPLIFELVSSLCSCRIQLWKFRSRKWVITGSTVGQSNSRAPRASINRKFCCVNRNHEIESELKLTKDELARTRQLLDHDREASLRYKPYPFIDRRVGTDQAAP
jgi:hypothetical protein